MGRVLIVEDDEMLRSLLRTVLEREFPSVETAADFQEATSKLPLQEPDLVISDYNLGPGGSGLALLAYLQRRSRPCPLILMSGSGEEELESRARRMGVYGFLQKPFAMDQLVAMCRQASYLPAGVRAGFSST
jgi:DNA-binding NtrC family response regulator